MKKVFIKQIAHVILILVLTISYVGSVWAADYSRSVELSTNSSAQNAGSLTIQKGEDVFFEVFITDFMKHHKNDTSFSWYLSNSSSAWGNEQKAENTVSYASWKAWYNDIEYTHTFNSVGIYYVFLRAWPGGTRKDLYWKVTIQEPTGSLRVYINPSDARSAGARFNVNNGSWKSSGAIVSGLSVGNHTVCFRSISGWDEPSCETVSVSANNTTTKTYEYEGNHAPVASRTTPSNSNITLEINQSQKFDVKCTDEDSDLAYAELSSSGKLSDKDSCWSCSSEAVQEYYSWGTTGHYEVTGLCEDGKGNKIQ